MTMVEQRSMARRVNAVDLFVCALVVVMIPIAYAAYALFRTPPAGLAGVEPRQLTAGPNLRVHVTGTNLRPFMRVSFNTTQGRTFLIGSTTSADVDLPDLEPGVYDVVLYDYAQEVARLPKALTIRARVPAPSVTVAAVGAFIGLSDVQAAAIKPGAEISDNRQTRATVLAVGPRRAAAVRVRTGDTSVAVDLDGSYELPAAIRLNCYLENNVDGSLRCIVYGPVQPAFVAPDSVLSLPATGGPFNFQVAEVHPAAAPTFVRVRLQTGTTREVASRIHPGDSDSVTPEYEGAWIGRVDAVNGTDIVLRLPTQILSGGRSYRNQPLKMGGPLRFETATAAISGTIADVATFGK
jgi:hypothetical protein